MTENKVIISCCFYYILLNNTFFSKFCCSYRRPLKIYFLKQETEQCAIVHFRQGDIAALFKTPPFTTTAALNISHRAIQFILLGHPV